MSFKESIIAMINRNFYGTEYLVLPSHIVYFMYLCCNIYCSYEVEAFLNIINSALLILNLFFLVNNSSTNSEYDFKITTLPLVLSFFTENPDLFSLDNKIFGCASLFVFLSSKKPTFFTSLFATCCDLFNLPFVAFFPIKNFVCDFKNNFIRRKSVFYPVFNFLINIISIFLFFIFVGVLDFRILRNNYSNKIDKFPIYLRNYYQLEPTDKYVMDRSEISLINCKHKRIIDNLIIEKIHSHSDIVDDDRFIYNNNLVKIQKQIGNKQYYLCVKEDEDTKFTTVQWILISETNDLDRNQKIKDELNQRNVIFNTSFSYIPEKVVEKGVYDSLSTVFTIKCNQNHLISRESFCIKHKSSEKTLCMKPNGRIYFSYYAVIDSKQFAVENNVNHPYYKLNFKNSKVNEVKSQYDESTRKNVFFDSLIYLKYIKSHKMYKNISFTIYFFITSEIFLFFLGFLILSIRFPVFNGLRNIQWRDMVLLYTSVFLFGCNSITFFFISYKFNVQLILYVIKLVVCEMKMKFNYFINKPNKIAKNNGSVHLNKVS
ncbi:hypothetical protein NUSPORA_01874 [Nucleospora cyclopteri]